jgi:hypothetical protein
MPSNALSESQRENDLRLASSEFLLAAEVESELQVLIGTGRARPYIQDMRAVEGEIFLSIYGAWEEASNNDRIYVAVENRTIGRKYHSRARSPGDVPPIAQRTQLDMVDEHLVGIMIDKMDRETNNFTR